MLPILLPICRLASPRRSRNRGARAGGGGDRARLAAGRLRSLWPRRILRTKGYEEARVHL
jgi:hypothetical protein